MLPLTTIGILRVMPMASRVVAAFAGPLNEAMFRWQISTTDRIAAFLAQAAHESAQLTRLDENLDYGAAALLRVWPRRFTEELAQASEHDPEAIANIVYADRMGNGDVVSGDGWLYRGRGIFQLTGRANYRDCSLAIASDADTLLINPELLTSPAYACQSAGWFWASRGLNELADAGDFEGITRRINGGLNGLQDRLAFLARARAALQA